MEGKITTTKSTNYNSACPPNFWLPFPLSGKGLILGHFQRCCIWSLSKKKKKNPTSHTASLKHCSHKGCLWPLHEPISLEGGKLCSQVKLSSGYTLGRPGMEKVWNGSDRSTSTFREGVQALSLDAFSSQASKKHLSQLPPLLCAVAMRLEVEHREK